MIGLQFLAAGLINRKNVESDPHVRKNKIETRWKNNWKRLTDKNFSKEEKAVLHSLERQILKENQLISELNCPECKRPFIIISDKDMDLECCKHCESFWFHPNELLILTGTSRDIPSDHLQHRQSKYNCPACHRLMDEYVYLKPFNLLVDSCPWDHGVYLEKGELKRAFELS